MFLKKFDLLPHFLFDVVHRARHFFLGSDVVRRRIDGNVLDHALRHAGDGVDFGDAVDFVAEHFDADDGVVESRRKDFDRIAVDAESPAFEVHVAAAVLDIDELMQDLFLRFFLPQAQGYDEFAVIFRVT